jgi:hypothetical protein
VNVIEPRTCHLVAPPSDPVPDGVRAELRQQLVTRLGSAVAPLPAGDPVTVTLPLIRQARLRPESLAGSEEAFTWRPVFVRRSLGLAVVEACVGGRFRTPLEAVGPVADEAVGRWEETGWRTFHWEPWVAGLAPGARSTVLAEAVGWASSLWSALDWSALPAPPRFGGADDQWVCPASPAVRLKGRSELRVPLDVPGPGRGDGAVALVSVSGGCPTETWSEELAYLALTASLRSPSRPVPSRVLGVWPDAGADRSVEIDTEALAGAAARVAATVAAVVDARMSPSS